MTFKNLNQGQSKLEPFVMKKLTALSAFISACLVALIAYVTNHFGGQDMPVSIPVLHGLFWVVSFWWSEQENFWFSSDYMSYNLIYLLVGIPLVGLALYLPYLYFAGIFPDLNMWGWVRHIGGILIVNGVLYLCTSTFYLKNVQYPSTNQ